MRSVQALSGRDGLLGLALKYWIRGDVRLADGTELSLDEHWEARELEPLSLLDPVPLELDVTQWLK